MGKYKQPPDAVSNLADLIRKPGVSSPTPIQPLTDGEKEEEHDVAEINAVLEFVSARTGKNIFDMQALLAASENELREQIREMGEEEDGN